MAPPYKVDVPPHHMQHRAGSDERILAEVTQYENKATHVIRRFIALKCAVLDNQRAVINVDASPLKFGCPTCSENLG